MNIDRVCECGHLESHHENLATYTGEPEDCLEVWCGTDEDMNCECQDFKADNLRTLERLSGR